MMGQDNDRTKWHDESMRMTTFEEIVQNIFCSPSEILNENSEMHSVKGKGKLNAE